MPRPFLQNRQFVSGQFGLALLFSIVTISWALQLFAQKIPNSAQIVGIVRDSAGKAVPGIAVQLREEGHSDSVESSTKPDGTFAFSALKAGSYTVTLRKSGFRDTIEPIKLAAAESKHCAFVLPAADSSSTPSSTNQLGVKLDDRPNFTVAGVTDTTGSGGHGSETRMRTGEVLARETAGLEANGPGKDPGATTADAPVETSTSESSLRAALLENPHSYEANRRLGDFYFRAGKYSEAIPLLQSAYQANPHDRVNAFTVAQALDADGDFTHAREQVNRILANEKGVGTPYESQLRHLLGEVDEKLGDSLAAEREYARATELDSSEQNYFAWGAELLLHRAAAPAIEVFGRGIRLHPDSARMLAGLGAALYTSGSTEDAAQRLCQASDLEPANPNPYLFLGKMQEAVSTPLPCVEDKLARFVEDQPANALANYYYAQAVWKRNRGAPTSETVARTTALLRNAIAIDPKFDSAYLQLGDLYFARADFSAAVTAYQGAVAANSASSQAHYRLGLTYKRIGEEVKSHHEFEQYKELEKREVDTLDRQRRELRQFLFVLKDAPASDESTKTRSK